MKQGEKLDDAHSFDLLPTEIWELIGSYLSRPQDRLQLVQTSRRLSRVIKLTHHEKFALFADKMARHRANKDVLEMNDAEAITNKDAGVLFGLTPKDLDAIDYYEMHNQWGSRKIGNVCLYDITDIAKYLADKYTSYDAFKKRMRAREIRSLRVKSAQIAKVLAKCK